jgi:hypothetical protein
MKPKQILRLTAFLVISTIIASCGGGGNSSVTIKPKTTSIKGDLGDYFVVVDKDYSIKFDEKSLMKTGLITVEVKRTDKDLPFSADDASPYGSSKEGEKYHFGFGIEIYDDNAPKQINNATEGGTHGPYSFDDVVGLIKLKKGETAFIRWSVDKADGLKSFQLTSAFEKDKDVAYSHNSSADNSSVNSTSGSEDWDKILNDYDDYTNQYISLLKKSKNNDASAISEYPAMMEKANELGNSLQKGKNQLSTSQMNRMVQIQTKLMTAVQDMK